MEDELGIGPATGSANEMRQTNTTNSSTPVMPSVSNAAVVVEGAVKGTCMELVHWVLVNNDLKHLVSDHAEDANKYNRSMPELMSKETPGEHNTRFPSTALFNFVASDCILGMESSGLN